MIIITRFVRFDFLIASFWSVILIARLRPSAGFPLQLPVLDLDLAAAGFVRRIVHASDLRADLLQIRRIRHSHFDFIHRDFFGLDRRSAEG